MSHEQALRGRGETHFPPIRLGINIDHVATLRNARGGRHPDPIRAAKLAVEAGADNITAHLREDRRHIRDEDIARLVAEAIAPLNLEMAVTPEMLAIALKTCPHSCCLVPERREEITTEGGLDVAGQIDTIAPFIAELRGAGILVSLFIDPDLEQIEASAQVGADAIELHTGTYCLAATSGDTQATRRELKRLIDGAAAASSLGLEVHAGHGLDYDNVVPVASIPEIVELNIGHYLVGEALFVGLLDSISRMRMLMDEARQGLRHQDTRARVPST
ncbi:MAG TPA: pyridoxine 5'-phosphate synthase [Methyloceanibacter sp.]|nr:pyridoxine 5'-phosphate synthase [Methyloceanibacter sp.]